MHRIVAPLCLIALPGALLLAACGDEAPAPAPRGPLQIEEMNAQTKAQSDRALAARDALMKALGGRLLGTVTSDGAVAAISICKDAAPEIQARIAGEHGVKIGRTSFKLRNPANAPPAWAAAAVDDRVEEPAWFGLAGGALGALLPIHIQPLCTKCHGPADTVSAEVKGALAKEYPGDHATGFAIGDLRGWFWVEVPARP